MACTLISIVYNISIALFLPCVPAIQSPRISTVLFSSHGQYGPIFEKALSGSRWEKVFFSAHSPAFWLWVTLLASTASHVRLEQTFGEEGMLYAAARGGGTGMGRLQVWIWTFADMLGTYFHLTSMPIGGKCPMNSPRVPWPLAGPCARMLSS